MASTTPEPRVASGEAGLTRLRKTDFLLFFNIGTTQAPDYARADNSTIFDLNFGTQTQSKDYIYMETPVEEVTGYIPEIPQEIALDQGNKLYDYLSGKYETKLPIGQECIVPCLVCFGGTTARAWNMNATLILGNLNPVDGKLTYTVKLGGNIKYGTFKVTAGQPVFTETVQSA